jgi:hypothetical protein
MRYFLIILMLGLLPQQKTQPRPEDYSVTVKFHGKPKSLHLDSLKYSRRLSVALQKGAMCVPNFADHYTIIQWPTVSACFKFGVADAITGEFYEFPDIRCNDILFCRESSLLIYNPIDSSYYDRQNGNIPNYFWTRFYLWNGKQLTQIDSSQLPLNYSWKPIFNIVQP